MYTGSGSPLEALSNIDPKLTVPGFSEWDLGRNRSAEIFAGGPQVACTHSGSNVCAGRKRGIDNINYGSPKV